MSFTLNHTLLNSLRYWSQKLHNEPFKKKFLISKTIEILSFTSQSKRENNINRNGSNTSPTEFPRPIPNSTPSNPKVSIVIPIYISNQKAVDYLSNLINSINKQTTKPHQVILVDDQSPLKIQTPEWITYFKLDERSGPAKARNKGKSIALEGGADIIAFTDSDCILSSNWLEVIAQSFIKNRSFQILSGDTQSYDTNWFGKYHNISGTLNGRRFIDEERLLYGTTANLAVTNEVADRVNFNERFKTAAFEDVEFCIRANQRGFAIKHIPEMVVYHNYGYTGSLLSDTKQFISKFMKYGRAECLLLDEVPDYYDFACKTVEIGKLRS